jgi:hypothetical protein
MIKKYLRDSVLTKIPYVKLLWYQCQQYMKKRQNTESIDMPLNVVPYSQVLDSVMARLHQIAIDRGVKLIIFYHPHLVLNKDGFVDPHSYPPPKKSNGG